ncbi:DUF2510 domain-containing protein [Nocardioides sp. URHA0032]|uniref:DUF2510 domain-containing protein n=1 Tax=Nocardioides sp. URHA0032 TaxID=1380388 RepID=UPI0009DD48E4
MTARSSPPSLAGSWIRRVERQPRRASCTRERDCNDLRSPLPPAGWHPDPTNENQVRFWDGQKWTEHTHPRVHGPGVPPRTGAPPRTARTKAPWWQTWWAVVPSLVMCAPLGLVGLWKRRNTARASKIAITVGVAALWIVLIATSDESPDEPTPVASSETETTPSSTPTPTSAPSSSAPATRTIPAVTGLSAKEARKALRSSGLGPVELTPVPSRKQRGTVLSVSPDEDEVVDPGTAVQLEVAAPLPRVPDVGGMSRAKATSVLLRAGFKTKVSSKTTTSGSDNSVLRQFPAAGRQVQPGSVVRFVVSDLHKPAPPASNCTSGYSPCLTPAYDYDCANGSGDGPEYVYGTVRVTGSDPYDLDRDGDGYGCD